MSDFGEEKWVKTRKPHSCAYCGRKIPNGTKARNYNGMWEGDWQNWYACEFCVTHVEPDYAERGEYISGDEFQEWFRDNRLKCPNCGTDTHRHEWDWIKDDTAIAVECCECEHSWLVEIPFTVKE